MSYATTVFESPNYRCRLRHEDLIPRVLPDDDQLMPVLFMANRIESSDDTELFLVGSDNSLGALIYKKVRTVKKSGNNQYLGRAYVKLSKTSSMLWFILIQKLETFFQSCHDPEYDEGPVILWSSITSTFRDPWQGKTLAVCILFDKWDGPFPLEKDSKTRCKICMEEDIQTAFVPCGHAATCWKCNTKVGKCPVCRADIHQRIRIYL
jgi:hypothetical protein